MQVLRWSAAAAFAAMVGLAPAYAGDDLSAMKASMDNMKVEMEAMRAQLAAEREAFRATAGGAPEALQSAKGNATIRIGGDVRFQYQIGWGAGYGRDNYVAYGEGAQCPNPHDWSNYRSTKAGWDVARAELDFDIDLSCDTKGFVSLRFDNRGSFDNTPNGDAVNIIDNAWWQWNNVGGSGFSLKIGLQDMPFGMYNSDMGGYSYGIDRPLITDPFVKNLTNSGLVIGNRDNYDKMISDSVARNVTNLGLVAGYNWDDQVILKAGIMASGFNNEWLSNNLTYDNTIRNTGFVDHVVALGWNPCWIEGLHLEAAYMGRFDEGMRGQFVNGNEVNNNPYAHDFTKSIHGDSTYMPSFDLGVYYKINCQWRAYAEGTLTWNPFYGDGYAMALTAGVDYSLTDKLMLGVGFDWMHLNYTGDTLFNPSHNENIMETCGALNGNLYRINLGAKYDFGNGLYFQAQYYHDLCYIAGVGDQDTKDADTILFQTGYQF